MEKTVVITVNGYQTLHLVIGHTYADWIAEYDEDYWDFPIEELLDGTVEINEGIWYWLIKGRCYETDITTTRF